MVIFAVLKFQFASNMHVLNFLLFKFYNIHRLLFKEIVLHELQRLRCVTAPGRIGAVGDTGATGATGEHRSTTTTSTTTTQRPCDGPVGWYTQCTFCKQYKSIVLYVCMYVCMYACMHACMYACTYLRRPTYVRTYVCIMKRLK